MAICTVYLSFVTGNMQAFFAEFMPQYPALGNSQLVNVIIVLPVAAGLTLMPNLRALGPISEVATLILFTAFGVLAILLAQNYDHNDGISILTRVDWMRAPMAICGILYTFEGICIVLPLEGAMKERAGFRSRFTSVYALITVLYICIGSSCVFFLGLITDGSITAFLAEHSDEFSGYMLVTIANLLVSVAVLLSYALAMFPCIELCCQALERVDRGNTLEAGEDEEDWWGGSMAYGPYDTPVLRLSLLASTVVIAVAIPNVQQLIGLAGAIAGSVTALIVPPLLDLKFLERGLTLKKALAYILLCLGIIFGTTGAVAALYDIYQSWFEHAGNR